MTRTLRLEPDMLPRSSVKSNPIPHILFGLIIVLGMFGGLGAWASIARLDGAIIAPGIVTVYSKRKTVQHLEGGIVAEIMVREGDRTAAGDLLVRLDDTRARANLAVLDGHLDALRAGEARLRAELTGQAEVRFPPDLQARAGGEKIGSMLAGEVEHFEARKTALDGQTQILTQRIAQLKEQIRGFADQEKSKSRQIKLINDELKGLRQLFEKGYAPKTRILALERTAEQLKGERGQLIADIARTKTSIGEAELQILQTKHDAQQEAAQEMSDVKAEILSLEERRVAVADEQRRLDIYAPLSGRVVGLSVHTVGGVIAPGQQILDIVPGEDELVVEARVAPQDIDKISNGQAAAVRFSAFNARTTPELMGEVFLASADRLVDEASGLPFYLVSVRVPDAEREKLGELAIVPGMPAEVFVATGERTALSYLVKPLSDAFARTFREE